MDETKPTRPAGVWGRRDDETNPLKQAELESAAVPPPGNDATGLGVFGYAGADAGARVTWEVWEAGGKIEVSTKRQEWVVPVDGEILRFVVGPAALLFIAGL